MLEDNENKTLAAIQKSIIRDLPKETKPNPESISNLQNDLKNH